MNKNELIDNIIKKLQHHKSYNLITLLNTTYRLTRNSKNAIILRNIKTTNVGIGILKFLKKQSLNNLEKILFQLL